MKWNSSRISNGKPKINRRLVMQPPGTFSCGWSLSKYPWANCLLFSSTAVNVFFFKGYKKNYSCDRLVRITSSRPTGVKQSECLACVTGKTVLSSRYRFLQLQHQEDLMWGHNYPKGFNLIKKLKKRGLTWGVEAVQNHGRCSRTWKWEQSRWSQERLIQKLLFMRKALNAPRRATT